MKRLCVMLAALVVLVAACGGTTTENTEGAEANASQTSDQTTSSAAVSEDDPKAASADDIDLGEDGELSLDDFFPGAGVDFSETDYRSQEMEIQQQISVCMAAEGFEYIPFVPSDVGGGFGYEESDEGEYVKTYGFGIATQVLQQEQFAYDEESDPWADDPNQPIIEAMDEFEQEEYSRLLHGGEPDIIANMSPEELNAMTEEELNELYNTAYETYQPTGCMNAAYEEAYGGGEADMAFWEEFGEDFQNTYTRAESDPRIVEAQVGWSACMAEKGHDYATQEDMYTYFYGTESAGNWVEGEFQQKVNEVVTWPWSDFEEGFISEGEVVEVETTIAVFTGEGEEGEFDEFEYPLPEYDIELLQPLIDEELAVAVANYECSQDMRTLQEEVYKELEQRFLEENLDRLLAFRDTDG